MKKYWVIFLNSLQTNLTYRFNTFTMFISELISFVVMVYLWLSIYHQGNKIGAYSLGTLIIYYLLTKFIGLTIFSNDVARIIGDEIREGNISNYLLKPINFLYKNFFTVLGSVFFKIIIYSLILFFIILAINLKLPHLLIMIYFIFSLLMATIINFLIFYIVGISTFYFGFIMGFNYIMFSVVSFFSGRIIPLDLLPIWLIKITNLLPFKFIAFVPISIITGKIDNILPTLFIGLIWVIILYFLAVLIYNNGLKKYEAYGS